MLVSAGNFIVSLNKQVAYLILIFLIPVGDNNKRSLVYCWHIECISALCIHASRELYLYGGSAPKFCVLRRG